jgi:hypothetical protein
MDWEEEEGGESANEDAWLEGREENWKKKGGRERKSSYNEGEEENIVDERERELVATPKKAMKALLVPDT